jgi:hypothetical protein
LESIYNLQGEREKERESQRSLVDIPKSYELDVLGLIPDRVMIFPFSAAFRPDLGLTQPLI